MEQTYHQKYYQNKKEELKQYYQDNKDVKLEYQNNYNKIVRNRKIGRLAAKRELVKKNLKKNEKKVEEFRNLLLNNKNT